MRRWIPIVAVVLMATACSSKVGAQGGDCGVNIVTTVSPITNIVQNVGGDRVEVTGIVPEGTNSHTFEPAPSDAQVLAEADIVFINGLHLGGADPRAGGGQRARGAPRRRAGSGRSLRTSTSTTSASRRRGATPTRTCGRTRCTRSGTRRSSGTSCRRSTRRTHRSTPTTTTPSRSGSTRWTPWSARSPRRCPRRTASSSPTTTPSRTSLASTGGPIIGAIQPSDFTDPTPRRWPALIEQIRPSSVPAIFGSEVFPSPVLEQIATRPGAPTSTTSATTTSRARTATPTTATSGSWCSTSSRSWARWAATRPPSSGLDVTNLLDAGRRRPIRSD